MAGHEGSVRSPRSGDLSAMHSAPPLQSGPVSRRASRRPATVATMAVALAAVAVGVGYVAGTSPGRPGGAAVAIASTPEGTEGLMARISVLETELKSLRRGDAPIPADLAYRIAMLERRVGETSDRVQSLRTTNGAVPTVIALDHLRRRVAQGFPFTDQLAAARQFLPDSADTAPATATLFAYAGRGVPTIADLLDSYTRIEPLIVTQAARSAGLGDFVDRLWQDALHVVGLAEQRPENPLLAGAATVRQALQRGQLAVAVEAASAMERDLGPIIAGWLSIARSRLGVERALEALERVSWQALLAQRQ